MLNTSNMISDKNIDTMGNTNASLLSLMTAPAKMAIPMIGLKLFGYIITLDMAAASINKTARIILDVCCLFIFLIVCAKISNKYFLSTSW
jgi:hypothetical protein